MATTAVETEIDPGGPPPGAAEAPARGYDDAFLGMPVPAPQLTPAGRQHAVGGATNAEVVPHTHYSLVMHAGRHLAVWVAWNIDGGQLRRLSRSGLPFVPDPAVDLRYQTTDPLYVGNRLDRGHLARRADLCWGPDAEARRANRESFYFTNITPQMENFNQSAQGGLWGRLEDAVFELVAVENLRVSAFGGPVFRADDPPYRGVPIPLDFYKVLAYREGGRLRAQAFLLTQSLAGLRALALEQFRVYQVTLGEVEARCEFRFPAVLKAADAFAAHLARAAVADAERPHLTAPADIVW